jgi:hypothetical protein
MGNNGRRQSAIASHPHGPRIVDGKLLVSARPLAPSTSPPSWPPSR